MSAHVAWAAPAGPSEARRPLREALPIEARGHWDAGVALARRGDKWREARASFNAAYELSKNPRVLFNVAVCEKELGRFAAAYETFKRELAEGKGLLSVAEEKEVAEAIAGLERYVAYVTIETSEKDADVFIDEEKIDRQKLVSPVLVSLGERRVRASKSGFSDAEQVLQLAGGAKSTVNLKLQALIKTARVNVSVVGPSSAIVKIDGKEVGPAPYAGLLVISAEPHQVSAEAPGFVTASQSALVKEGEVLNLTLQLAAEQQKGKLVVVTRPEGGLIEIDGKFVGATRWEGPVDARTHQVVVKKEGFYPFNFDVEVPKGGERSVSATLNEDRNTSFVPWLIGSLVVGAALTVGIVLIATPKDEEPVSGTLTPGKIGTTSAIPSGLGLRF
jgi:hypothetical protein